MGKRRRVPTQWHIFFPGRPFFSCSGFGFQVLWSILSPCCNLQFRRYEMSWHPSLPWLWSRFVISKTSAAWRSQASKTRQVTDNDLRSLNTSIKTVWIGGKSKHVTSSSYRSVRLTEVGKNISCIIPFLSITVGSLKQSGIYKRKNLFRFDLSQKISLCVCLETRSYKNKGNLAILIRFFFLDL